jgi:PAS domain S-box-containing protein
MADVKANILNVDDDEIGRYAISRILTNAGYEVIEASTGQECLDLATKVNPDLIVLDIQLPDISGYDVCRRLKADPVTSNIAILHLSASFINSQDQALGLEGGADGFLTQPVEPPVLIGHVKALLRMRHAEHLAQEKALHWQATFNAISDAIFLADDSGCILQCNAAMSQMVGFPAEEITGSLVRDISRLQPGFPDLSLRGTKGRQINEVKINNRWFLVTWDLIGDDATLSGNVCVLTDITTRKIAEEENTRLLHKTQETAIQQRAFMRDMLSSVTDGKLHLCDSVGDLPQPLQSATEELPVSSSTLSHLRIKVRDLITRMGFSEQSIEDFVTAVNETSSNAVMHAGGGSSRVYYDEGAGKIQVWIQDSGNGIEVERLPRATLQRGYSTAGTFGHGFKIIIHMSDRVWLLTDTGGTTVIIEKDREPPEMNF